MKNILGWIVEILSPTNWLVLPDTSALDILFILLVIVNVLEANGFFVSNTYLWLQKRLSSKKEFRLFIKDIPNLRQQLWSWVSYNWLRLIVWGLCYFVVGYCILCIIAYVFFMVLFWDWSTIVLFFLILQFLTSLAMELDPPCDDHFNQLLLYICIVILITNMN